MKLRNRVARLEAVQRSRDENPVVTFLPREHEPDYHAEASRIEALKVAGRKVLIIDDSLGQHELWAGGQRLG